MPPEPEVEEEDVKEYYERVERHLKERGIWEDVVKRFPPKTIEAAIRDILERLYAERVDPEVLDWGSLFEMLPDFESIDDFLRYLEEQRYIPPSPRGLLDEAVKEVIELIVKLRDADPRLLQELAARVEELVGRTPELLRLREELSRLRREVHRLRAERDAYARRVEELKEELKKVAERAERAQERARPPPHVPEAIKREVEARLAAIPGVRKYRWWRSRLTVEVELPDAERALNVIKEWRGRILRTERRPRARRVVYVADFAMEPYEYEALKAIAWLEGGRGPW